MLAVSTTVISDDVALARYPGSSPCRALLADEPVISTGSGYPAPSTVLGAFDLAAGWQAGNPWLSRIPMSLGAVTVVPGGSDDAVLVDVDGTALALAPDTDVWPLLALSGGHPVDLFGEWYDGHLHPCSVAASDGRLVSL